ncbi:MAG: hypothetical protein ACOYOU_02890 [Kiritimatiellia bacterium]
MMPQTMLKVGKASTAVVHNSGSVSKNGSYQFVKQHTKVLEGGEGTEGDVVAVPAPATHSPSDLRMALSIVTAYVESTISGLPQAAQSKAVGVVENTQIGRNTGNSGERVSAQKGSSVVRCTVERICGHFFIKTSDGEMVILDLGRAAWRLLLLVANAGKNVPLANVFHADRKKMPFIIVGKGGLRGTGMDKDGTGSLSYNIPVGHDDKYLRELGAKIMENRCAQNEAIKCEDDVELALLQDVEDKLLAAMREKKQGMEKITRNPDEKDAHSTALDIHALYMSIMRAIDSMKSDAPRLAAHLKARVKANGTIRYEKTVGWDWEFMFDLERVNLCAGEVRDAEEEEKE